MNRRRLGSSLIALAALGVGCASQTTDEHVTEQRTFGRTAAGFQTVQECEDAQARGDYPPLAACQDQLILCPDGRAASLIGGDVIDRPSYRLDGDLLTLTWSAEIELTGTLAADGTLTTTDGPTRVWQPVVVVDGIGWELTTCDMPWGP